MANNDLAIRFTEETYATKSEVAKELRMSLIDTIWSNILSYRSNFNRYLSIRGIDNTPFKFCYCSSISSKIENVEMNLMRVMKEVMNINEDNGDYRTFRNICLIKCLKEVATTYKLDVTDEYLRSIINREVNVSPSFVPLANYADALRFIETSKIENVNVDYLAEIYSHITATPELVSFYRTQEDKNPENKVLIDRIYSAAPTNIIETMMDNLFTFLHDSPLSTMVKAIITFYYIDYVKPFPKYNSEIAILLMKSIVGGYSLSSTAVLLNFESFININEELIVKMKQEVQKTDDITYFVNFVLPYATKIEEELLDSIASFKADSIKTDFYRMDEKKVNIQPAEKVRVETASTAAAQSETVLEKTTMRVDEERVAYTPSKEQIAVSYIPPALDEKEASRLEEHLLELDPSMRRGEAAFYARHCTLGKKYTISQCKKFLSSAYETARKTMERLTELGYYRKEMVKNKSVYTPIPRK